jgi:signal recognition particle receptor subunit beta
MALLNRATGEVHCKIVYYGPGFGGKTTNLEWLGARLAARQPAQLTRLATRGDRTLYFDLLPVDLGAVCGYRTRLHLYTVPGQPRYNASRRILLQGADGIVFVADSHPGQLFWNRESYENLRRNLAWYARPLESLPIVFQYNKRDLPDAAPVEQLDRLFGNGGHPRHLAAAVEGAGVVETLKSITAAVLNQVARPPAAGRAGAAG